MSSNNPLTFIEISELCVYGNITPELMIMNNLKITFPLINSCLSLLSLILCPAAMDQAEVGPTSWWTWSSTRWPKVGVVFFFIFPPLLLSILVEYVELCYHDNTLPAVNKLHVEKNTAVKILSVINLYFNNGV